MFLGPRACGPQALTAYVSFEAEASWSHSFFALGKLMMQEGP